MQVADFPRANELMRADAGSRDSNSMWVSGMYFRSLLGCHGRQAVREQGIRVFNTSFSTNLSCGKYSARELAFPDHEHGLMAIMREIGNITRMAASYSIYLTYLHKISIRYICLHRLQKGPFSHHEIVTFHLYLGTPASCAHDHLAPLLHSFP